MAAMKRGVPPEQQKPIKRRTKGAEREPALFTGNKAELLRERVAGGSMTEKQAERIAEKHAITKGAIKDFDVLSDDEDGEGEEKEEEKERHPGRTPQSQRIEMTNTVKQDQLRRLASKDLMELQQLTNIPVALIDSIAKGMAYFDSTFPIVEAQCLLVLEWHYQNCIETINAVENGLDAIPPEKIPEPAPPKPSFLDKIFFKKPKPPEWTPELQFYPPAERLEELYALKAELEGLIGASGTAIDTDSSYFKRWASHFYIARRSVGGNAFEKMVLIGDSQVVTGGNRDDENNPFPLFGR